jgi:proteasome lid subunit RPN8/RPN11
MKYKIVNTQLNKIMKDARTQAKNGGQEICGLLVDNGYHLEMIQLKNKSKRGGNYSFYLKEADSIQKACKIIKHTIVGTFHSHPFYEARPGDSDKVGAFNNEIMLIIDVTKNETRLWKIEKKKERELEYVLI